MRHLLLVVVDEIEDDDDHAHRHEVRHEVARLRRHVVPLARRAGDGATWRQTNELAKPERLKIAEL